MRNADQWHQFTEQAKTLSDKEVKRHASVSLDNRHSCVDCFTCACVHEVERRSRLRRKSTFGISGLKKSSRKAKSGRKARSGRKSGRK